MKRRKRLLHRLQRPGVAFALSSSPSVQAQLAGSPALMKSPAIAFGGMSAHHRPRTPELGPGSTQASSSSLRPGHERKSSQESYQQTRPGSRGRKGSQQSYQQTRPGSRGRKGSQESYQQTRPGSRGRNGPDEPSSAPQFASRPEGPSLREGMGMGMGIDVSPRVRARSASPMNPMDAIQVGTPS